MSGYNSEYGFDMESGINSKDLELQTLITLDEQAIWLGWDNWKVTKKKKVHYLVTKVVTIDDQLMTTEWP